MRAMVLKILVALMAGGLNALAFAPFYWWPLGLFCFVVLFSLWLVSNSRQSAIIGFFFGLGLFGIGISWIYISIHHFGGMPPLIAGFCIFVFVCLLSLFPAACGWVQALFSSLNSSIRMTLVMSSLWIMFEWLRGWVLTGFPWLTSGYAFLETPLSNFAPIGGVYFVGLIALVSAGILVSVLRNLTRLSFLSAVLIGAVWFLGWQLNETSWTKAQGDPIDVALVQLNVPLSKKWNDEGKNGIIQDYVQESFKLQDVDLVVWPEAAIPDFLDNLSDAFWNDLNTHPADFLFGVLHRNDEGGQMRYYNSAVAVSDQIMLYRKQHLVPFGEYFPMQTIFQPLINMLNIPMSDFSPWTRAQLPLSVAGNKVAISICYEDAFPGEWRSQVVNSGILANISEDSWFGDSFAPHQRLQMARFRSRESERPMVRSSNSGLSALINWKGGIDTVAQQFQTQTIKGQVQARTGLTPYMVFGDKIVLYLLGGILMLAGFFGRIKLWK